MSLKEAKKQLLYALDDGLISDEEMQNDECLAEFRLHKNGLPILAEVLRIPDQFISEQRSVVGGMEALCMLLKRLTYPC